MSLSALERYLKATYTSSFHKEQNEKTSMLHLTCSNGEASQNHTAHITA
ncbi:hypothetical protein BCUN_2082 [Bifidobacterium cuniculi]|uniref:Uncharacterized protein n=1 Tax=Bifidobacterium cuniculi TaxID=1688 RepID=A0A087AZL8_9BIFI|nr:hypothetical protein BCUN_2082 [Bifidobacterium cuniculi]